MFYGEIICLEAKSRQDCRNNAGKEMEMFLFTY